MTGDSTEAGLPESLIVECAESLGAFKVPIEAIQKAWKAVSRRCPGCLNTENGKRLFIAYRLRELGCFAVGCHEDNETGTGCFLHFFDIYTNTKNLTDEEFAAFMNWRHAEAKVAATKLWKLIDSKPVNALAARATYFKPISQQTSKAEPMSKEAKGIQCPHCGGRLRVRKTRACTGCIRRRRVCWNCKATVYTTEKIVTCPPIPPTSENTASISGTQPPTL